VVDQLCNVTAWKELIAAVVIEAALDARLGALPAKSARVLARRRGHCMAGWVSSLPAFWQQGVAAAAAVTTSLAGWQRLDQGVEVDVCGRGATGRGRHGSPWCWCEYRECVGGLGLSREASLVLSPES
jgi:hypothetical protein